MTAQPDVVGAARRWAMLAAAVAAQGAATVVVNGAAFLLPVLHLDFGLSLSRAGLLVALPSVGTMLTLIAWGALADRFGDRLVLTLGLALTAVTTSMAAAASSSWLMLATFLLLAGAAAASANAASGRVVVGWFPARRRGLAMGIRQSAQPLGVAVAALTLPALAATYGLGSALLLPAAVAAVVAVVCAVVVLNPPRPARTQDSGHLANPYRGDRRLLRIHAISVLLVVPQFTVLTFALVWLVSERGWSLMSAGLLVAAAQVFGALGRLGVGVWSDRVGSRLRPLRIVAVAVAVAMGLLAFSDRLPGPVAVATMVAATIVTVAPNGLAFTSVAEIGGPWWAGRALGAQNTAQFFAGSIVPPLVGALVGGAGYPLTFAVVALFPLLAVPFVPVEPRARPAGGLGSPGGPRRLRDRSPRRVGAAGAAQPAASTGWRAGR